MHPAPDTPIALLRDPSTADTWLSFESPREMLQADSPEQVRDVLERVEQATREGLTGVGFVAYEAASAFDSSLVTRPADGTPLAWFGLFRTVRPLKLEEWAVENGIERNPVHRGTTSWRPSLSVREHEAAVSEIHRHIALGDTYQVNLTFRLDARLREDAAELFLGLVRSQPVPYSAFLRTREWAICSVSPELFFSRTSSGRIVCRPMKGTAPRGRTTREDAERADWLRGSKKNRAENVMIVDMVRNDLGRIARPGTVRVQRLFELERYHSVHQLTSTVEAESEASLADLFAALFPCASVTGAPKVRTMELISELENRPRGVYTGAIGFAGADGSTTFSVAIRTVWIDRLAGRAVYGTGGGVVWDSSAEEEFRECRTKALVLLEPRPEFSLLETILWRPRSGCFLLERHLERLASSAHYFDYPLDGTEVRRRLAALSAELPPAQHRLRLLVGPSGDIRLEAQQIEPTTANWRVALAQNPVDREDRFLFHKTTFRKPYERATIERPGFDDVLLWNAEGEITESTVANVVIHRAGRRLTPHQDCGLLAGTLRQELLDRGLIEEAVVTTRDLVDAERVSLINSVRGWIDVDLCSDTLSAHE